MIEMPTFTEITAEGQLLPTAAAGREGLQGVSVGLEGEAFLAADPVRLAE
jgi:hypothetical protein